MECVKKLTLSILCQGPIPKHIAFIMDGNRRYAVRNKMSKKSDGHIQGYQKLEELLEWCFTIGIKTLTLFAFSVENFKRPMEEVEMLMNMAIHKLKLLSTNSQFIRDNKVAIRVIGELDMLPENVQRAAQLAHEQTKDYDRYILNICFPYTSKHEILSASNRFLQSDDSSDDFSRFLYTKESPPVDILIRTSGEFRLSEFLNWQVCSSGAQIEMLSCLWPEISVWRHLVPILLKYQALNPSKR